MAGRLPTTVCCECLNFALHHFGDDTFDNQSFFRPFGNTVASATIIEVPRGGANLGRLPTSGLPGRSQIQQSILFQSVRTLSTVLCDHTSYA